MNCPKCSANIDEKMLVCPSCKKVLKLQCPECKTINKKNVCKTCGYTILTKCHKCGKVNQTKQGKCSKCGFSTDTSVMINSSMTDEFACLTIDFPNMEELKPTLGSTKLFAKFKQNLDTLILNFARSQGLTRQIIDGGYIIRFNKDASFYTSSQHAMESAIEIQNLITGINFKLSKTKEFTLRCNIAVLKRDIHSKPSEYKSGLNINMVYQSSKKTKLLNNLQIITDSATYEVLSEKYPLSSLTSVKIKDELVMFFELNLKNFIKIPKEEEKEECEVDLPELPKFSNTKIMPSVSDEDEIYNIDSIDFDTIKCDFKKVKSVELLDEIIKEFKQKQKAIVSVKTPIHLNLRSSDVIKGIETAGIFSKVLRVTCYEEMKYEPYGFFYELISNIYNYAKSTKLFSQNDFSMFDNIDDAGFIKDLINMRKREFPHPEDVRYSLFDLFFTILSSMQNCLIYVEDFEKIDDSSAELLPMLFEKFEEMGVSYLFFGDEEVSLHKNAHFLLSKDIYSEFLPKPTPFEEIFKKNASRFKNIVDSHYLQVIGQNSSGSLLYLENALDYLVDLNVFIREKGIYQLEKTENVLFPLSVEDLAAKRIKTLSKNANEYKAFAMILLLGPRVDFATMNLLGCIDGEILQNLINKKFVYSLNNAIYVENFSIYRKKFLTNTSETIKQQLAQEIIEKAFMTQSVSPVEARLYNILEKEKSEFSVWEKLSHINTSMGDFSAYLNCSVKFLKLIDNHIDENSQKTIEEYKMEVYENLSNLLYKYTPEKIQNIAQIILENLEKSTDDKKVINLCNKMLQGCLISGNYSHALRLTHKILSKMPNVSLNPEEENFSITYFLISLIKIEILFSIGDYSDCVEAGDEILEVLNSQNLKGLKPDHLTEQQFNDVIFDAMGFVALSRVTLLKEDLEEFISKVKSKFFDTPKTFELFIPLLNTLKGEKVIPQETNVTDDKFSKIIYHLINAFSFKDDYQRFAKEIYQVKINTKLHKLHQLELFCDLMIGFSYFKLQEFKKASSIYYSVAGSSFENGLKGVTFVAWYLISLMKSEQNDFEVAEGIATNASIQLEKDPGSSEFLLFLFKSLLAKIFDEQKNEKSAQLCFEHAIFIKDKYNLKISVGSLKNTQTQPAEDNNEK